MNNIKLINQDLVGFFTSVPQAKIMDGVHRTIQLYCTRSGAKMHDSFRTNTTKVPERTIKANVKQFHKIVMNLHQLQTLAKWVVHNGYFQVQQLVMHQILGAPIGNPISPVLCSLAFLHQEIQWHAEHDSPYQLVPIRFVDSLLTITDQPTWTGWPFVFSMMTQSFLKMSKNKTCS